MKYDTTKQYRKMTQEELEALNKDIPPLPYKDRIINRIRERYSVDDEIAIIRQRDTKPLEFEEYNVFVEQVKAEEKIKEQEENYET